MNAPKLFTFLTCCFISFDLFAQTPKAIEADLYDSFKKIDYWNKHTSIDTSTNWSDSLEKANDLFGKKLKYIQANVRIQLIRNFQAFQMRA